MPKKATGKTLRVTLVRSPIGYSKDQKATVRALGLRRMNQTVEHNDSPAIRGMVTKIIHLVRIEE
jgi:large subunit ribosomal protein L30